MHLLLFCSHYDALLNAEGAAFKKREINQNVGFGTGGGDWRDQGVNVETGLQMSDPGLRF